MVVSETATAHALRVEESSVAGLLSHVGGEALVKPARHYRGMAAHFLVSLAGSLTLSFVVTAALHRPTPTMAHGCPADRGPVVVFATLGAMRHGRTDVDGWTDVH